MDNVHIDRRIAGARGQVSLTCRRNGQHSRQISLVSLYTNTRSLLYYYTIRITGSREVAEEVVQDVYTYAWLHTESYDGGKSDLIGWLRMLCRTRAIDYLRSNKKRSELEVDIPDLESIADPMNGPDLSYVRSLETRALHLSMKQLSSVQRQTLVLHYFSELPHSDIAVLMSMPLGTVKTTIRRAKQTLALHPLLRKDHT